MRPKARSAPRLVGGLLLVAAMAVAPVPAWSGDRGVFDIYLGTIRVGLFAFSGVESGGRYSTAGQLRSTGLIGALADVRYDAKSQGRIVNGRYVPEGYVERASIGARSSDLVISYKNGVPEEPRFDPPRDDDRPAVDPGSQGDAVDLMTLFYTLLKDVPEGRVCRYDSYAFDGVRRTRVIMRVASREPGRIVCEAEYRRIAGFTAEELRDRPVFPFRLAYAEAGGGDWTVVTGEVETVYGVVRLERRTSS